jgi:hypothetical protein
MMNIVIALRVRLLLIPGLLILNSSAHAAALRTVALSGQPAAGTDSGVNYKSFGAHFIVDIPDFIYFGPVINDAGQVAFRADLAGTGVDATNDQGVWSEGSGALDLVARVGSPAPGAPDGVHFGRRSDLELFEPVINSAGQTAFYGALTDGSVGIWSEGSGSLALVAHDGMQVSGAPEGANHNFGLLRDFLADLPYLNDAGQTAFWANLSGEGVDNTNDWAVWSDASGSLGMVARAGTPAPGVPEGVNFDSFFVLRGFNNAGQTAFFGFVTGEGVDPSNDQGIWSEGSGSLALVARSGNPAPGTPSGVHIREFFYPVTINNAGQTLFSGWLTGDGVDATNDEGLWLDTSGTVTLVARSGDPAPGTPDGVRFAPFSNLTANAIRPLNDAGQVAFRGQLTGTGVTSTNDLGIWVEGDDSGQLVARTGDLAPGTTGGIRFNGLGRPALNDAGQVAFRGDLTGSSNSNLGIWATNEDGVLQLIARKGSLLEVAPGDSRTISDLGFVTDSGNSDGRPSAFNDLGQLVYWARFTNGTQGVFVSNVVAHLPGDFNNDGTVDVADYVVWRQGLGTIYEQDDHDLWRANFGRSLDVVSGVATGVASVAVPEPVSIVLAASALGALFLRSRRRTRIATQSSTQIVDTYGRIIMKSLTILNCRSARMKNRFARKPISAIAIAAGAVLSLIAVTAVRAETIEFDASRKSPAVIPFEPDTVSLIQNLYVSGRIPTNVKGPIIGGTNVNTLIGADAFYSHGYTGASAVIANVEGGHIWSEHETLTHTQQIQNHPQALNEFDRHATWVGMALAGRQGGANPGAYQEGLAPGAQLFSGNIISEWSGIRGTYSYGSVLDSVLYDQYRRAISTGVDESGRTADVVNSSWGGVIGSNGSDSWSIALDGLVNANPRTLFTVSAGNDGPGPEKIRRPAAAFNNMAVAALGANPPYDRPAIFSSGGPNDYSDPVNGTKNAARQVIDIAAPGENLSGAYYGGETGTNGTTDNPAVSGTGPTGLPFGTLGGPDFYTRGQLGGTSLAAPTVAGGAALLYDAAYDVFSDNGDARDARVMKAVLMNSADKTVGWNNGQVPHPNRSGGVFTTQGLDNRVGTGRMNLDAAYDQFLSGTTDIAGTDGGNLGVVDEIGWDFGQVVSGTTNDYYFDSPLEAGTGLTATLTWFRDRRINSSNTVFDDSYDDLNLELWRLDDGIPESLISESSSLYNESEHFSFAVPETGDYALRVRWFKEVFDRVADADQEFYGLAWSAGVNLAAAAIPEPSSFVLLVIAAMACGSKRRRFRNRS